MSVALVAILELGLCSPSAIVVRLFTKEYSISHFWLNNINFYGAAIQMNSKLINSTKEQVLIYDASASGQPNISGTVTKIYLKYSYKFETLVPFKVLPV